MQQVQLLEFAGADTKAIEWDGQGTMHVSVSGAGGAVTKLVYSHDGLTWHDHDAADSAVTGDDQFGAIAMPSDRKLFWLGIQTDGAARVVVGKID